MGGAPYIGPRLGDGLVYRARPFLALVLYARGEGSSKGHVWYAINQ